MRTVILTLSLISATLVALTPNASACEVSDPTGLGAFCVNEYEDGWGDQTCEESGYHREGVRGNAKAPGVGSVVFDVWQYCYKSPFREYDGTNAFIGGGIIDTASFIILFYSSDGSEGPDCTLVVDVTSPAGNHGHGGECTPPDVPA